MNGFNLSNIQDAILGGTQLSAIYFGSSKLWPTVIDYSKEYLTIESIEDNNTIYWKLRGSMTARTIQWSTDKTNWSNITATSEGTSITTLNAGDKIYLRGNNTSYGATWDKSNLFSSTDKFNVYGNIMSLINYPFVNLNLTSGQSNFYELFRYSKVVDASNLILPTSTLHTCYFAMFSDCSYLTYAPVIRSTGHAYQCYSYMFDGCSLLSSIEVYSEAYNSRNFDNWMRNVAASGTFTKKASMTLFSSGASGIPKGWTVIDV